MTLTLAYDQQLSRVRVTATALPAGATTAKLERSLNGIRWELVRGGLALTVITTAGPPAVAELDRPADDYEFAPDVENTWRLTTYDAGGVALGSETAALTPALGARPWLKAIARPYLNAPVTVQDYSEVTRPGRAGLFDVVGRSFPVAVAEVRGSSRYTLFLLTETREERRHMAAILAAGEVLLLQVPATADTPAGYLHVGAATEQRTARRSERRIFALEVVEVAAPDAALVGATSTWETVRNNYAQWGDVLAAYATWADLLELIAQPEDVIVS